MVNPLERRIKYLYGEFLGEGIKYLHGESLGEGIKYLCCESLWNPSLYGEPWKGNMM